QGRSFAAFLGSTPMSPSATSVTGAASFGSPGTPTLRYQSTPPAPVPTTRSSLPSLSQSAATGCESPWLTRIGLPSTSSFRALPKANLFFVPSLGKSQTSPSIVPTSRSSRPVPSQSAANAVEALPSLITLPSRSLSISPAANRPLPWPRKRYNSPGQEPESTSAWPSPSRSTNGGVKPTHQPEGTLPSAPPAWNHVKLSKRGSPLPPLVSRYRRSLPSPNWPTSRCRTPSPVKSATKGAACPMSTSIGLPPAWSFTGGARPPAGRSPADATQPAPRATGIASHRTHMIVPS